MLYGPPRHANRFVLIAPDGSIAFNFTKVHPVPLVEADVAGATTQELPVVGTRFGRVAGAICFDFDFPRWMKQVRCV